MKKQVIFFLTTFVVVLVMLFTTSCGKGSTFLSATDDTISPTLITRGPMMVKEGHFPDYKTGIKADDNTHQVKLTIDSSEVDIHKSGTYNVTFTASDSAGNTTSKTETLQVVGKDEKIIYLTFDDGPSVCTPEILRILKENGVHATFFVTAQFKPYLHYLADIAKDGNVVAPHSYTHQFSIYQSFETYFADLEKMNDLIYQYTGTRSHLVRFPGGSSNHTFRRWHKFDRDFMWDLRDSLNARGYQYVDWNLDSKDAEGCNRPASILIASACHTYRPQMCLLMHDTGAKKTTVEALPTIIKYFKDQGYEFGVINSVDYVCHHGGKRPEHLSAEKLDSLKRVDSVAKAAKAKKTEVKAAEKAAATTAGEQEAKEEKNSTATPANESKSTATSKHAADTTGHKK